MQRCLIRSIAVHPKAGKTKIMAWRHHQLEMDPLSFKIIIQEENQGTNEPITKTSRKLFSESNGQLCEGTLNPLVRLTSNFIRGHKIWGWSMEFQDGSENSSSFELWSIALHPDRPNRPHNDESLKPLVRLTLNFTSDHIICGWSKEFRDRSENSSPFSLWSIALCSGRPEGHK